MGKAVFVGLRRLGEGGGHLTWDSRRVGKRGQLDKKGVCMSVSWSALLSASAICTMSFVPSLSGAQIMRLSPPIKTVGTEDARPPSRLQAAHCRL